MLRPMLGFSLSAALLIGCGGRDPDRPRTVPASVTVTYQAQPVEGATVTFHPAEPQQHGSVARTDARGRADLWTFERGDGVIPGSYSVMITKIAAGDVPDPKSVGYEEYLRLVQMMEDEIPHHEVPERYSRASTSGLTAEVVDGGDNNFTFELQD